MFDRKCLALTIALAVPALVAPPLQAQQPTRFGAQISFANNANVGIGARMVSDFAFLVPSARNISLIASFDYFFPGNNVTYWELNGNAVYRFTIAGARIMPYAGGGLDVSHASLRFSSVNGTQMGLNLVAGTWFDTNTSLRPYLELRAELAGAGQFVLTGGLLF